MTNRDPYQPFDRQPAGQVNVHQYAPPPRDNLKWLLLVLGSALAIVAILIVPQFLTGPTDATPPPTTPAVRSQPTTTPGAGNGVPVEGSGFAGYWMIDSHHWEADGLVVRTTLRIDQGELLFTFFSFDPETNQVIDPSERYQDLKSQTLRAGDSVTGTLKFKISNGDATVILANGLGRQITALRVSK